MEIQTTPNFIYLYQYPIYGVTAMPSAIKAINPTKDTNNPETIKSAKPYDFYHENVILEVTANYIGKKSLVELMKDIIKRDFELFCNEMDREEMLDTSQDVDGITDPICSQSPI